MLETKPAQTAPAMQLLAVDAAPYLPTADDRLWLLRAVECEGAVRADVARTLVNLFMYLRAHLPQAYVTLTQLVQAYSQPVNPKWYVGGKEYLRRFPETGTQAEKDAYQHAAQIREQHHAGLTAFSAETVQAVDAALNSGCVGAWSWEGIAVSDVTDYAAPGIGQHRYERRSPDIHGRNTLWTRGHGWAGYTVGPAV